MARLNRGTPQERRRLPTTTKYQDYIPNHLFYFGVILMVVVVKRKNAITAKDVLGFKSEWLEKWKEWVVIHDLVAYSSYDDEAEARKIAKLLQKASDTVEDIEGHAEQMLEDLTEEELEFLREYTGGTIKIEV